MLNLSLWCMQNAYICSAYTILPKHVQNLSVRFLFVHLISSRSILLPYFFNNVWYVWVVLPFYILQWKILLLYIVVYFGLCIKELLLVLILVYISAYIGRQNSYDPWYCIKSQHVIGHLLYEFQAYQEISYDFEAHSELPFQRCDRCFINRYLLQFHIKETNLYRYVGWLGFAEKITKILVLSIHFTPQLVGLLPPVASFLIPRH